MPSYEAKVLGANVEVEVSDPVIQWVGLEARLDAALE
jgi:hypothetical protein